MTFLALATLTWHAWSMLRNRWWGGVGCNSIVDLARRNRSWGGALTWHAGSMLRNRLWGGVQ